jgi:hypothetical protein
MNTWLVDLIWSTNGRPFSEDEAERIATYAETLPERLLAVQKLEDSQKWLVKQLNDVVAPKAAEWGLPKEPFTQDFAQSLTALAHAMLTDDFRALDLHVIQPMKDLAEALDIPGEELGNIFNAAWDLLNRRIDPTHAKWLEPYFTRAAQGLDATVLKYVTV